MLSFTLDQILRKPLLLLGYVMSHHLRNATGRYVRNVGSATLCDSYCSSLILHLDVYIYIYIGFLIIIVL